MPPALAMIKGGTKPEKQTRTRVDTIELTPAKVKGWTLAPFQRPLKVNYRVKELAETIKNDGGVIPGVITLGHMGREQSVTYLLDGQHRREAFLLSGCEVGYVDIREAWFDTFAEMGEAFVALNSSLVKMTPDDILRGLEQASLPITKIRHACPFVGYDHVRRGGVSPVISMSAAIRCWEGGRREIPSNSVGGVMALANGMTVESADELSNFLNIAFKAWGRDHEYWRLWGNLNLVLCMWLYQKMVIGQYSARTVKLSKDLFCKCLMSLSADSKYLDWLLGRNVGERDRSPCYDRIRGNFVKRIQAETGKKPLMPAPGWATNASGRRG